MENLLMGVGMSASTGYRPFIPLLVISIASRFGAIKLAGNIELMNSNLFIGILMLLIVVELFSTSIPYAGRVMEIIGVPVTLICGYLAITSLVGNTEESNQMLNSLIGIVIGSGSAGIVKATAIGENILLDAVTLGAAGPVNAIKDTIKAFFLAVLAIVAPIIVCIVIILFLFLAYQTIKKLRSLKAEKNNRAVA